MIITSWITSIFILFIYQPFLNLLVGVYYLLDFIPGLTVDMGWAVIIFTIVFRILWLPISLSSDRKEGDKRRIAEKIKELSILYAKDPIVRKAEERKLMIENKGLMIATYIDIGFQVIIALMLYRIFSKGLMGVDFHYLYHFIPAPDKPFNLMFLGRYDLTHPNITLNVIQTVCILVIEILSVTFSPFPARKRDLSTVFILPLIAYLFFSLMPAGKKLFVIVTLLFSIILMLVKRMVYWYHNINNKLEGWVTRQGQKKNTQPIINGV